MKKQEFIIAIGFTPSTTKEAVKAAEYNGIKFKRRNAHLKAWFGKGKDILPSSHNLSG